MTAANPNTLDRLAGSAALAVAGRIGVPIVLALVGWLASAVLHTQGAVEMLSHRVSVVEGARAVVAEDVSRRLSTLEAADLRDREMMVQLRGDVATLLARDAARAQQLDRIERAVDRGSAR